MLIAVLAQHFFRARRATDAEMGDAGQEATIVVLGDYRPPVVRVEPVYRCG